MEKLNKIIKQCKCGVYLKINEHRDYYQSVEDYLKEHNDRWCPLEISDNIKEKMIELDTIIQINFYPITPIGFYSIYHYDLNMALDISLKILEEYK